MPTLKECKQHKWLQEHHIKEIEDRVANVMRDKDGGIFMAINFEDWDQIHPAVLTGPTHTANVIVEPDDVLRIKRDHKLIC
jgi:hypothetical protein